MVHRWRRGIRCLGATGAIAGTSFFLSQPSAAQLLPDNSLGAESSIITPGINGEGQSVDLIEGGAQRGTNLFHSFQEFNIGESQRASFASPVGVENILSRVTGSNPSNILGALGVLGDANLFLINPQGILFGPNATLDVRGSFIASTASSIRFSDNVDFSATNPSTPPLLAISIPLGLQFNGGEGDIVVQAGQIPKPNNSFIEVDDAGQLLDSAQVVNSPTSEVIDAISGNLDRDQDVDLYQIYLEEGQPFTASTVGNTNLNTQLFLLDSNGFGLFASDNSVSLQSTVPEYQALTPTASGTYYLAISNYPNNPLNSQGYIFDAVGNPQASGAGFPLSGWNNIPAPSVKANTGAYTITLNLRGEGLQVPSGRTLALVGGTVRLEGGQLQVPGGQVTLAGVSGEGVVKLEQQGLAWQFNLPDELARANVMLTNNAVVNVDAVNGGSINLYAKQLNTTSSSLLAGIAPRMAPAGSRAGNIEINTTDSVNLDASTVANTVALESSGVGGDLNITTGSLSLTNGTGLSTITFGDGKAGSINIVAQGNVSFDYAVANSVVAPLSKGVGGNIRITANSVSLTSISQLAALTQGEGDAGDVEINARDTVHLDGRDPQLGIPTGLFSAVGDRSPTGQAAKGQGGTVQITARSFLMSNGAAIEADINGRGKAGNVSIVAYDQVNLDGKSEVSSGVQETGSGDGGNITIATRSLSINQGSQLTVSSAGLGQAGSLNIEAETIRLDSQGQIRADTIAGGGNIDLRSPLLTLRRNSSITTNASGAATGGNINIDADFVVSAPNENNDIIANAFEGSGGQINLTVQDIFWFNTRTREDLQRLLGTTDPTRLDPRNLPTNDITAFSQANPTIDTGSVTVQTPDLDPAQGLTTLTTDFADPSQLMAATCPADEGSSFAITGRGGLPEDPRQPLVGQVIWQDDRRRIENRETEKPSDREIEQSHLTTGSIAEAQGWIVDRTGAIVLVAQTPTNRGSVALKHPDCAVSKRSL